MSLCKQSDEKILITSINTPKEKIEEMKEHKMKIVFYDYPEGYYDEVGGYHDCGEGWNPHGIWCGECSNESCANCPCKDNGEGIGQ